MAGLRSMITGPPFSITSASRARRSGAVLRSCSPLIATTGIPESSCRRAISPVRTARNYLNVRVPQGATPASGRTAAIRSARRCCQSTRTIAATVTANSIVASTLTWTGMPRRARRRCRAGRSAVVPELKFEITKSSIERAKASSGRRDDPRREQGQGDVAEGGEAAAPRSGRLLEAAVEADQPRAHDDHDEADREHDVGDEQRLEPGGHVVGDEHREQRGADHDLGRRHRQDDQQVRRPPPKNS